jgi:hypothetical protein
VLIAPSSAAAIAFATEVPAAWAALTACATLASIAAACSGVMAAASCAKAGNPVIVAPPKISETTMADACIFRPNARTFIIFSPSRRHFERAKHPNVRKLHGILDGYNIGANRLTRKVKMVNIRSAESLSECPQKGRFQMPKTPDHLP